LPGKSLKNQFNSSVKISTILMNFEVRHKNQNIRIFIHLEILLETSHIHGGEEIALYSRE